MPISEAPRERLSIRLSGIRLSRDQISVMRCPTLIDLPPPPPGKTGWPWTEESPQLADTMSHGECWPAISIVTPNYNQGQFIEETIRSVLLQGYPNLEYIIVDGGSTDESIEVISKYQMWFAYWVSEKDRGQAHAVNKGLRKSQGEIIAYLNSDDTYLSGTVQQAVGFFVEHKGVDIIYGDCAVLNEKNHTVSKWHSEDFDLFALLCQNFIYQPTVFMRRRVLDLVGYFDEGLSYAMDLDYWYRAASRAKFAYCPGERAVFRVTCDSKTGGSWVPFVQEEERVLERFFGASTDQTIRKWRKRVLARHYYYSAQELYRRKELSAARHVFIKGMRLDLFSVRTWLGLLAVIDTYMHTRIFAEIVSIWAVIRGFAQKRYEKIIKGLNLQGKGPHSID